MIDLKDLRENPEKVKQSQIARGENSQLVDQLLELDNLRRKKIPELDQLRFNQKQLSKEIANIKTDKSNLLAQAQNHAKLIKQKETELDEIETSFKQLYQSISNIILPDVPVGDAENYEIIAEYGEKPKIAKPLDHLEIAENLGLIDVERGVKVAGSRSYFLTGLGALLHLALLNYATKIAVAKGFILMIPPVLVKPEIMSGTGFLGAHQEEIYFLPEDKLYLVGTSEVALAGYHSNEILASLETPLRYAGWSTCFRREAGSYGKDTRGIIRVHQFDKVEMFIYCLPEHAETEHNNLLELEKQLLLEIGLPFRVVNIPAEDLGASAAKKYDCEAWLPSQNRYLELTSTSNCTTFQARRLGIRYRNATGKTEIAATLNGTLATMRWLVAILENYQQPDGSLTIPSPLVPYVGIEQITKSEKILKSAYEKK